jgi:very-short-patch-repair endonuclease
VSQSDAEQSLAFTIRALRLSEPEREYLFAKPIGRRWRFDFAWPEAKVGVEVDGGTFVAGRHTRGKGYEADVEKLNTAAVLGWTVLRVTPHMINDGRAADLIVTVLTQRGVA